MKLAIVGDLEDSKIFLYNSRPTVQFAKLDRPQDGTAQPVLFQSYTEVVEPTMLAIVAEMEKEGCAPKAYFVGGKELVIVYCLEPLRPRFLRKRVLAGIAGIFPTEQLFRNKCLVTVTHVDIVSAEYAELLMCVDETHPLLVSITPPDNVYNFLWYTLISEVEPVADLTECL